MLILSIFPARIVKLTWMVTPHHLRAPFLGSFVAEPVTDGNDPKNPIIQILLRNAIPAVHADSIPRINILIDLRTGNYVHKQEVIDKDNNISGGITVFYGICGTHKTLF